MRRRSPARWLAPLALVTAALAVYAIVHSTMSSSDGESTATTSRTSTQKTGTGTTTAKKSTAARKATYTVVAGDVLSSIAAKNRTTVAELQRLNPSIDASALHPGQKLKLPR
jgi:LysM repeat protein